jgi:ankyrin repeat protein
MSKTFNNQQLSWRKRINDHVIEAIENKSIAKIINVNWVDNLGETCLFVAIERNNINFVKFVLSQGADPNYLYCLCDTYLKYAMRNCNIQIVALLLDNGANSNHITDSGLTPLHLALELQNIPLIKLLLEHGADPDFRYLTLSSSVFYLAVSNSNVEAVRLMIEFGADVNYRTITNRTIISEACSKGNLDIVIMIGTLCNPEHITEQKGPIESAAKCGYVEIVEYLLVTLHSPLHNSFYYAIFYGWMDIVNFLLSKKEEFNLDLNTIAFNPLKVACECGNVDMVDRLMLENVDIVKPSGFDSHIMIAVKENRLDIVKRLVSYGDDYNYQNLKGNTALHIACQLGLIDIVNFLLGLSVNVNCVNTGGDTALIKSCVYGHYDIIRVLIASGADTTIIDNIGGTAVDYVLDDRMRSLFI